MATSLTFFGIRSGSTHSLTFAKGADGSQITKDKFVRVEDPKTRKQMMSRATLAVIGKFHSWFHSRFFEGAFEDKKAKENSYNVFVRKNRRLGVIMTPEQLEDTSILKLGRYRMSYGSLAPFYLDDNFRVLTKKKAWRFITDDDLIGEEGALMTVGTATNMLRRIYPEVGLGEIITLVRIEPSAPISLKFPYFEHGETEPLYELYQFATREESEQQIPERFVPRQESGSVFRLNKTNTCAACMIRALNIKGRISVSTQNLVLSSTYSELYNLTRYYGYGKGEISDWANFCADEWGAKGKSVLDGIIADQKKQSQ